MGLEALRLTIRKHTNALFGKEVEFEKKEHVAVQQPVTTKILAIGCAFQGVLIESLFNSVFNVARGNLPAPALLESAIGSDKERRRLFAGCENRCGLA